jgi:hypothetical protein
MHDAEPTNAFRRCSKEFGVCNLKFEICHSERSEDQSCLGDG